MDGYDDPMDDVVAEELYERLHTSWLKNRSMDSSNHSNNNHNNINNDASINNTISSDPQRYISPVSNQLLYRPNSSDSFLYSHRLKNQETFDRMYEEAFNIRRRIDRSRDMLDVQRAETIRKSSYVEYLKKIARPQFSRQIREGETFHERLYNNDKAWLAKRDELVRQKRELLQKERDEKETASILSSPQLSTYSYKSYYTPLTHDETFEALYRSKDVYEKRAYERSLYSDDQRSKEISFTPKINSKSSKLAEKRRNNRSHSVSSRNSNSGHDSTSASPSTTIRSYSDYSSITRSKGPSSIDFRQSLDMNITGLYDIELISPDRNQKTNPGLSQSLLYSVSPDGRFCITDNTTIATSPTRAPDGTNLIHQPCWGKRSTSISKSKDQNPPSSRQNKFNQNSHTFHEPETEIETEMEASNLLLPTPQSQDTNTTNSSKHSNVYVQLDEPLGEEKSNGHKKSSGPFSDYIRSLLQDSPHDNIGTISLPTSSSLSIIKSTQLPNYPIQLNDLDSNPITSSLNVEKEDVDTRSVSEITSITSIPSSLFDRRRRNQSPAPTTILTSVRKRRSQSVGAIDRNHHSIKNSSSQSLPSKIPISSRYKGYNSNLKKNHNDHNNSNNNYNDNNNNNHDNQPSPRGSSMDKSVGGNNRTTISSITATSRVFEDLYNARETSSQIQRQAQDKYMKIFSHHPDIGVNSYYTVEDNKNEFFQRLYDHTKYHQKLITSITENIIHQERGDHHPIQLTLEEQDQLFDKLAITDSQKRYLKSVDMKWNRLEELDHMKRNHLMPKDSYDISINSCRKALGEIFDVLILSADLAKSLCEQVSPSTTPTSTSKTQPTSDINIIESSSLSSPPIDTNSAIITTAVSTSVVSSLVVSALATDAIETETKEIGKVLDTTLAQPYLLKSNHIAEAITIVLDQVRPRSLYKEEFIDLVEDFMKKGKIPPITTFLTTIPKYEHRISKAIRPNPHLIDKEENFYRQCIEKSKNKSEKLAKRRQSKDIDEVIAIQRFGSLESSSSIPSSPPIEDRLRGYKVIYSDRKEKLAKKVLESRTKELTFSPNTSASKSSFSKVFTYGNRPKSVQ